MGLAPPVVATKAMAAPAVAPAAAAVKPPTGVFADPGLAPVAHVAFVALAEPIAVAEDGGSAGVEPECVT